MTTARNATLEDLVTVLQDQHARKHDIVVPTAAIHSEGANLIVKGAEQEITDDGVTCVDGTYRPTKVCDEGLAGKLGIPVRYLARLRADAPDLYDANINGWLRGERFVTPPTTLAAREIPIRARSRRTRLPTSTRASCT